MLRDIQIFLLILGLAQVIYYLIPRTWFNLRVYAMIVLSHFFILYVSPMSFLFLVLTELVVAVYYFLLKRVKPLLPLTWVFTSGILLSVFIIRILAKGESLWDIIGSGFIMIRSLGIIWDLYNKRLYDRALPKLSEALFLTSFFPTFAAGPIERINRFQDIERMSRPTPSLYYEGLMRIVIGAFKIIFLGNILVFKTVKTYFSGMEGAVDYSPEMVVAFILLKFWGLYLNFSGVSDVAIGSARLFGFRLTENFNKPWMSSNILDFWRRWHISLANFVNGIIFTPLARLFRGKIEPAVFFAFVIIGLWHAINIQYILWGIAHGGAMAIAFRLKRISKKNKRLAVLGKNLVVQSGLRVITIFYVAWLSMFSNASSLEAGVKVTLKLIGIR